MKVMCINDAGWCEPRKFLWFRWNKNTEGPAYGDFCTVVGECIDPIEGFPCYILDGWSEEGYCKSQFIPLSDIDETELVAEREAAGV